MKLKAAIVGPFEVWGVFWCDLGDLGTFWSDFSMQDESV